MIPKYDNWVMSSIVQLWLLKVYFEIEICLAKTAHKEREREYVNCIFIFLSARKVSFPWKGCNEWSNGLAICSVGYYSWHKASKHKCVCVSVIFSLPALLTPASRWSCWPAQFFKLLPTMLLTLSHCSIVPFTLCLREASSASPSPLSSTLGCYLPNMVSVGCMGPP